jgi:branched-chain amino acid transport system ATP-binding protein
MKPVSKETLQLKVEGLSLSFGGLNALTDIDMEFNGGGVLAIIGPNGAGKTCLLNCLNGFYRPQKGKIYFNGEDITRLPSHKIARLGLARTFQNIELYAGLSTVDNLLAARHIFFKDTILEGAIYFGRTHRQEVEHRKIVEEIIDFLEMEAVRETTVGLLPYGVRKRVELGRALAMEPKILLLDEPMAGMNLEEKEDMARFIIDIFEEKGIPIIMIEHDMGVVMDIVDRIVVLDFGCKIAEGAPAEIKVNQAVISAYLGKEGERDYNGRSLA